MNYFTAKEENSVLMPYREENISDNSRLSSLDEYRSLIENLAANQESMIFFNSGREHAGIVISTIFKYSNELVHLYAGKMNGGISNQECYLQELKGFLDRRGKIKLLLQEFDENNNIVLFKLLSKYQFFNPAQVQIRTTKKVLKNPKTKLPVHFCTGDNRMYRVEEDIKNFTASGSFNDHTKTAELVHLFNAEYSDGSSVTLN